MQIRPELKRQLENMLDNQAKHRETSTKSNFVAGSRALKEPRVMNVISKQDLRGKITYPGFTFTMADSIVYVVSSDLSRGEQAGLIRKLRNKRKAN